MALYIFAEVMEKEGYTALVTAHHADDQAETVLMCLIEGVDCATHLPLSLFNPLPQVSLSDHYYLSIKPSLKTYFTLEDSSNTDLGYFRNRVRNNYIPQLKQENPKIDVVPII